MKSCPFILFLKDVSLCKKIHLIISKTFYQKHTEGSLEIFFVLKEERVSSSGKEKWSWKIMIRITHMPRISIFFINFRRKFI